MRWGPHSESAVHFTLWRHRRKGVWRGVGRNSYPTLTLVMVLRASNRWNLRRRCRWFCMLGEELSALGTALGECGPLRAVASWA